MSLKTGCVRPRTVAIGLAASVVALAAVGAAGAKPTHRSTTKAITLTIGANAVVGGKNDLEASWVVNYIIPNFEKQMAAAGDPVDVQFQGTGVADEAYKTQLALDLKTGGGADIVDIDDIWVGEFAQAGYTKPLDQIVGSSVDSWDGWKLIPKAVKADMAFEGKQYGVPTGPDGRVIYYNKDLFQQAGLPTKWQPRSWADILATARKLKAKLPNVTPLQWNAGTAMGEATTAQGFLPLLAGTGKLIYDTPTRSGWGTRRRSATCSASTSRSTAASRSSATPTCSCGRGRDRSFQEFSKSQIAISARATTSGARWSTRRSGSTRCRPATRRSAGR